jgi:hypothetical protein
MSDDALFWTHSLCVILGTLLAGAVFGQFTGTFESQWKRAAEECRHGVYKVYIDGDYVCKEKGDD